MYKRTHITHTHTTHAHTPHTHHIHTHHTHTHTQHTTYTHTHTHTHTTHTHTHTPHTHLPLLLHHRYTLTGGEASYSPSDSLFQTLRITLSAVDVVALRDDNSVASTPANTYLALSDGAVSDHSRNPLLVSSNLGTMAAR